MANHEKKITLTDLQQKILSNDLYNDVSDNKGIDEWLDGSNQCSNDKQLLDAYADRVDYKVNERQ